MDSSKTRVVITGIGVISPVGLSLQTAWEKLVCGRSGIGPISLFDCSGFDVRIAGEAHGFDPLAFLSPKEVRRTDRFVQFAAAALEEALAQSRLDVSKHAEETGAVIGSGVGGIKTYTGELDVLREKGPRRVNPFLIPSITVDVPSVFVALRTGAKGPNFGVASACATGADAIGQAFEIIKRGHAKAMFTGGFEAAVTPIGIAAFDQMRALSHRNDEPEQASRPFDLNRDGFVMAEGGALLVLEDLEFALRRGAEPLAEVLSYAATSDAAHLTDPDSLGTGAAHCMRLALERAGVQPQELSYINTHGTGTPAGDPSETRSLRLVLGDHARKIPCSSTKSMTGHLLAGAGALEAAVCVMALRTGIVPPTINLTEPDPDCDLDYAPLTCRKIEARTALSNAFGFGGHNAALVFGKYSD